MKKLSLILLIILAVCQLRAQQLDLKPADTSLLFTQPKSTWSIKPDDGNLLKNFKPLTDPNQLAMLSKLNDNTTVFYSTMPVARVGGNIDNMPIAQLQQSNMQYPILIKRFKVVNPLEPAKVITP